MPTTVREVQVFLRIANYHRKFIRGFLETARPLTQLTKKDHPFAWGYQEQKAFKELKEKLANGLVIKTFDPEVPITIETDALDFALVACLSQPDDARRAHPVMFHS